MERPNGKLIPVGGAEDKGTDVDEQDYSNHKAFFELGILRCILKEIPRGTQPQIEVLTTASSEPDETYDAYRNDFNKLGCPRVRHLKIQSRTDADSEEVLHRLSACNCILIS
jgi:cyanophycinase